MKIFKFFANLICATALTMPAMAQVPSVIERVDYNNKLYLTVTTPYVGYTSWFLVWVEAPGNIVAVFTNNDWGGSFSRCRYDRGMWHLQALCAHGEERELKLLKGEVTCDELSALGDMSIMYARVVGLAPWVPPGGTPSFDANIVEIGTLYKFYTQGNKGYCRKTG